MTDTGGDMVALRVSDADRNGTMRRLHNAVALGLIDIDEFEQRSSQVSYARTRGELDHLVGDLPGPGAIVTSAADRVELRGWAGSLKRHGEWTVPTRLALVRRLGSVELDSPRPGSPGRWWSSNWTCGSAPWRFDCPTAPARRSTTSRSTWAAPAIVAKTRPVRAGRTSC